MPIRSFQPHGCNALSAEELVDLFPTDYAVDYNPEGDNPDYPNFIDYECIDDVQAEME